MIPFSNTLSAFLYRNNPASQPDYDEFYTLLESTKNESHTEEELELAKDQLDLFEASNAKHFLIVRCIHFTDTKPVQMIAYTMALTYSFIYLSVKLISFLLK